MNNGFIPLYPHEPDSGRSSKRTRWIVAIIFAAVLVGALANWMTAKVPGEFAPTVVASPTPDTLARAPAGTRIRVRVLNTTSIRGLARSATFTLRELGYDVVDFDSERGNRETTLILAHTARTDWAKRLQRAVGTTAMESRADTSRYLDFTVLIGRDWQLPSQTFRP